MSKLIFAVAALIGTIIGAGVLGIPYVIVQSGFGIGFFHLVLILVMMVITMLYLGEIALRTKTNHHLAGYAEKYLGKKGKILMFLSLIFGIYSAILAYLIAEGESWSFLLFNTTQYEFYAGLIFWLVLSAITYFGLKAMEEGEVIGVMLIFLMIISIVVLFWNKIDAGNLSYVNMKNFFVPFGVILFAYLGFTAIPEIERILGKEKRLMKKTIISANLIAFVIYTIFALVVVGVKGAETPELATLALGKPFVLLGIATMFTSYLALSIALIDTMRFDFSFSKRKAWLSVISAPIIIYTILQFFNIASFVKILGIGGVISGGLTAILILFMARNAKKLGDREPEYSIPYSRILTWILLVIFAVGTILELVNAV